MPLVVRHTGQNMFNAFVKVVDVVMLHWRDTLFSVSSDGAQNMTGRDRGIVSLVARAISPDRTLLRTWCGAHQLDIVFQKVVSKLCDDEFYTMFTSLIGYLHRQLNFIGEVGGKCPTVATTRLLSFGRVLKWLVQHRSEVMNYLNLKNPSYRPSVSWWIAALSMQVVTAEVDVLFKSL